MRALISLVPLAGALMLLAPESSFAQTRPTATSRSAPGPVIGLGLPAIAAVGVYLWCRRRQQG
jgi:hypothetical protein